jgi:hypothetical protein
MGAVTDAEGVVHVTVESIDEPVHEGRVVAFLPGIEAEVVQESHPGSQLGQSVPHRSHVVATVSGPVGATQVGAHGDVGPLAGQPVQCGHGRPYPKVVGHLGRPGRTMGPSQGDVEVGSHQDVAAADVGEVLQ